MIRPWHIWTVFALCFAVLAGAMGWISVQLLEFERIEAESRHRAEVEEKVRLALWRMDSELAPFVSEEAARPYFEYTAFYPAEAAYTHMFNEIGQGEVLMPSPLQTAGSPYVLLYFQIHPDGSLTSPQAPTGEMRTLAESRFVTTEQVETADSKLTRLAGLLDRSELLPRLPRAEVVEFAPLIPDLVERQDVQAGRNVNEYGKRWDASQRAATKKSKVPQQHDEQKRDETTLLGVAARTRNVNEGPMRALWVGDTLLLARRVSIDEEVYIQGAWLNWDALRAGLAGLSQDLVPDLELVKAPSRAEPSRMLASLPVLMNPGLVPTEASAESSPMRMSLLVAWICVLLGACSVAFVVRRTVALSERRADFVSAVSHELRTPLTTFRMYTEMLATGMVKDDKTRAEYHDILNVEAQRLGHLVENVLAYARLERGAHEQRMESVTLSTLLDRVASRVKERAQMADMEIETTLPEGLGDLMVRADITAVEQIIFNLVDNACKYAAGSSDRRIHLEVATGGKKAEIRVRDHGPGIALNEERRLFRPFRKSAQQAANSAPGVGLGLALARRLARAMGGELSIDRGAGDGSCFVLRLRCT